MVVIVSSRAPRGARGLKLARGVDLFGELESRPARGARIETKGSTTSGSTGIESRPARGARIETLGRSSAELRAVVAPRAGRAD